MSVVYQTAAYGNGGAATPLFIGLTLGASIAMGGALTGASLNPARTLGPALIAKNTQDFSEIVVYLAGIFGGGALAGLVHSQIFQKRDG